MNIDSFYGHVIYKGNVYVYTFNDYILQLIPGKSEDLIVSRGTRLSNYLSGKVKDDFIDDLIISGTYLGNQNVIFCISDSQTPDLRYKVKWLYIYNGEVNKNKIKGINFTSQEINYFYDIRKYMSNDFELNEIGSFKTFTVNINSLKRTKMGTFKYGEKSINIYGDMAFKKNYNLSNNLELWSILSLEASRYIVDLNELYNIVLLQKSVIDLITYRTNNTFDSIETYKYNDKKQKIRLGLFYICDECVKERDNKQVQHLIKSDNIKDIGVLYNYINTNRLYLHHICNSQKSKSSYTPSRMLGIMIAFERIVNWKYEKNTLRNDSYIKLLNRMKKLVIDNKDRLCLNLPKNKIKFEKNIDFIFEPQIPFSTYIIKVVKEYPISLSFILNIYNENNPESIITDVADRINTLRNAMAHGKIDISFEYINTKDIKFMEALIYILILSELNLTDDQIIEKIIWLFNYNSFKIIKKA